MAGSGLLLGRGWRKRCGGAGQAGSAMGCPRRFVFGDESCVSQPLVVFAPDRLRCSYLHGSRHLSCRATLATIADWEEALELALFGFDAVVAWEVYAESGSPSKALTSSCRKRKSQDSSTKLEKDALWGRAGGGELGDKIAAGWQQ